MSYNKSFTAAVIQSDDEIKGWYSDVKNALLSYGVKSRMSWKRESFNKGRDCVAKMVMRGKTLCLYLATDPAKYADTKYKVEEASTAAYADTPCLFRIKNDRRAKYALDLIAEALAETCEKNAKYEEEDFRLPFEETEALVEKGLIKVEEDKEFGFKK